MIPRRPMWEWAAACPDIKSNESWWRYYLDHCWASGNPFTATVGQPDTRGQRHQSVEGQCHNLPETDIGLCYLHYKEIINAEEGTEAVRRDVAGLSPPFAPCT